MLFRVATRERINIEITIDSITEFVRNSARVRAPKIFANNAIIRIEKARNPANVSSLPYVSLKMSIRLDFLPAINPMLVRLNTRIIISHNLEKRVSEYPTPCSSTMIIASRGRIIYFRAGPMITALSII